MTEEQKSQLSSKNSCEILKAIQANVIEKLKNEPPFGHCVVFSQQCSSDGTTGQLVIDIAPKNPSIETQAERTLSELKGGKSR